VKFSVALHNAYEGLGYPIGFAADPSMFVRLARTAESLGYDGVWANDHLVAPDFLRGETPHFYEPLVTLAHVAAVTERIRLGTAVVALPLREPLLLAKQVATLGALSGGRIVLGVGLGAYPEELAAVSLAAASPSAAAVSKERASRGRGAAKERASRGRGAAFDERLSALRRSLDVPGQRRTPLYIGGHGPQAVERAARWGDGWIPGWQPLDVVRERVAVLRERLAAVGRDVHAVVVAPELSALVAARHEDAVSAYEASRFARHRRSRDRTGRDPALMAASNLVGSPEAIRAKVAALADAGVDECAALAFPAETESALVEQWQRFAEEVIRPLRASG
jgi:alkanesulfonate monooxygenase SsuD/methylene tetrahydromethanopterin reductase-like flavin-dependent oxidoreductase (luciferase family)